LVADERGKFLDRLLAAQPVGFARAVQGGRVFLVQVRLELIDDAAGPIDCDLLPKLLEIRARNGGEALRPGPRARTQALKKLIQAAKMSVEERAHLPLVFSGDRLIAAGDRWVDASIAANDKSRRRARLAWLRAR